MMPCITVVPRLRTVAVAFVPSGVSHDHSWVGETRSVPCPVPCADESAQAGRVPVAFLDVSIEEDFGFAERRPVSFSRTDRRRSHLVW